MASVKVPGGTIELFERGTGSRPVVLLHGFPLDHRVYDDQAAALADAYRVITPDLRGFGQSLADEPFTIESLADDVHAALEQVGALPCVLGGLSMGGYVALAYVMKYPTDLKGLVLNDTKADADSTEAKAGRLKMVETCRQGGARAVADQMQPKMLAEATLKGRPDVVARLRSIMEACPPKTIENALLAMRDREDYVSKLASIAVPTLLIFGEHDAITPPSTGQFMNREIPHSKLEVIPAAGHVASIEQPEKVTAALRAFLPGCFR